jgi:glycosyltransferase involved in cell wall biosynthesis
MLVWLITVGERLPTDGPNERLFRTGTLAKLLIKRGHKIIWWTSTFDHITKSHRFSSDTPIDLSESCRIWFLHANAYNNNVSLRRMMNHYGVARKFRKYTQAAPPPNVILCSLPTLELSLAAAEYGYERKVPVVLDVRDLWPDIFLDVVPKWTRKLARLCLRPMFQKLRRACSLATAIVGITPGFVNWGLKNAGRCCTSLDRCFPLAYTAGVPSEPDRTKATEFWKKHQISEGNGEFLVCYVGSAGRVVKLEPVIEAARILKKQNCRIRFILCGNHAKYKKIANDCENIIFPGWVDAPEIWVLMRLANAGLLPYTSRKDFEASIPNKVIEYMSAGLPILSSVQGELGQFIENQEIGLTYSEDDASTLVNNLQILYDNAKLLKTLSHNAHDLYKTGFVAENVYNDMVDYLEEISRLKPNYVDLKHN